jgi:DNA mismatch repair protein MutL
MSGTVIPSRRVRLLRDDVARKIAAGEVIDRPFSVVRELMDNAIDAGAATIRVDLKNGGIGSIRVVDDGSGMDREDLALCFKAHATSKIETVEDLYHTTSLGFRGEALGSIGSCARLSITSSRGGTAHRLEVREGEMVSLEPYRGADGTSVEVEELFYNLPGRRRFLKSAQTEGNLCRTTFLEKAAAFPEIQFQLLAEGRPKLTLPAGSLVERAASSYPAVFPARTVTEIHGEGAGYSFTLVTASPDVYRRDRRYIHVYLNRRRIQEFSLMQAVEYGFSMLLPGGSFPVGLLFIEVDPELADFNIHPAKREARIRNLKEIHHGVSSSIQQALSPSPDRQPVQPPEKEARNLPGFSPPPAALYRGGASSSRSASPSAGGRRPEVRLQSWKETAAEPRPDRTQSEIRYIGQLFDLFLLCELGDRLYMVDQHAAHERILYDRLSRPGQESQGLMIPLEIEVEGDEESAFYRALLEELEPLGFRGELSENRLVIRAVPVSYRGAEKELIRYLEKAGGSVENFLRKLYADIACKAAVKDGEVLERISAEELLRETFRLPDPRCPHGRPVWFELSRKELFELVGRT